MKHYFILLSVIIFHTLLASAEEGTGLRNWTSADGEKSFIGEFRELSGDTVYFTKDGKKMSFPLEMLHEDDIAWIQEKIREREAPEPTEVEVPPVFDTLNFGDNKTTVIEKLSKSKFITRSTQKSGKTETTFLGTREQLDGIYKTSKEVEGLSYKLYFFWKDGGLSGIELRSEYRKKDALLSSLAKSWGGMTELLKTLYGSPVHAADRFPYAAEINEHDGITGTHQWNTDYGTEVILGPALDKHKKMYYVCTRITQ